MAQLKKTYLRRLTEAIKASESGEYKLLNQADDLVDKADVDLSNTTRSKLIW